MERTIHAGFVAASLRHPGWPVPHGAIDATVAKRHASVIRLTTRWAMVEYTPNRISRRFSLHEAKMLGGHVRSLFADRSGKRTW